MMRGMRRHSFSGGERAILSSVAERVFAPNRETILENWAGAHDRIDIYRVFPPEVFAALCDRELAAIIEALESGDTDAYLDHARVAGTELAEVRFSFSLVPALIHQLEDCYIPALFDDFRHDPELARIFLVMDVFLHDVLQEIGEGYFDVMRQRITQELAVGRVLEEAFRPSAAPPVPGLEIGVAYNSATEKTSVGGDFYDFFWLAKDRLAFAIGDVSGKGIDAASTAAMTKHMLRGFAQEAVTSLEAVERLNRALGRVLAPNEFVTGLFSVYEPTTGELKIIGAGHPGPFHKVAGGGVVEVALGGTVLGVTDEAEFSETTVRLSRGDRLLFYTDGLIEARAGDTFYGPERAAACLSGLGARPAQEVVDKVLEDCLDFTNNMLRDDVALVCLKRRD